MSLNFTYKYVIHTVGITDMPKSYDMGPTALLPLVRKQCYEFLSPFKTRRPRPRFNPRTLGLMASTLNTRSPKAILYLLDKYDFYWEEHCGLLSYSSINKAESSIVCSIQFNSIQFNSIQFNSILYFNVLYQQPNGQLQIQHKQTKNNNKDKVLITTSLKTNFN
jgi:hypothetical protein